MADKKDRNSLEQLFQAGDLLAEEHFAQLIASGINQEDDGLRKSKGTPLEIQMPQGDPASPNAPSDLIRFYKDFDQPEPAWKMRLRNDGIELGRGPEADFFLDSEGKIGIGTVNPQAKLDVRGLVNMGSDAGKDAEFVLDGKGNIGIGTVNPKAQLDVRGLVAMGSGSGTSEAPNYNGLVIRRINSTKLDQDQIIAKENISGMSLVRDGTKGGFIIVRSGSPQDAVIVGFYIIHSVGSLKSFHRIVFKGEEKRIPIISDDDKAVHIEISFGKPLYGGGMTKVVLTRFDERYHEWVGTLTSTTDQ